LSQTPKRPGTRDISELKARLGLKKKGPEKPKANGGVTPPPGVSIPAPPGAARPQPAQPAIPSAEHDPFGAMNAMAQHGVAQRAPEIVIVNDGKGVESVATGHGTAWMAKIAAIVIVPLILGVAVGKISAGANAYNDGIVETQKVLGNVKTVKKDLVKVQSIVEAARKNGFKVDPAVTKQLDDALKAVSFKTDVQPGKMSSPENTNLVFHTPQEMPSSLSGQVLTFYSHVGRLSALIQEHVTAAKTDDLGLQQAGKAAAASQVEVNGQPMLKYAIVLSNPTPDDVKAGKGGGGFGAQLVELGPPFCQDGSVGVGGQCPGGIAGLGYRADPSGGDQSHWQKGDIAQAAAGQPFPLKSLVILAQTGVLDTLVKGADPSASELLYQRRLKQIGAEVGSLLEEANHVEGALEPKAHESPHFHFFI
jgi:hypothetical protein